MWFNSHSCHDLQLWIDTMKTWALCVGSIPTCKIIFLLIESYLNENKYDCAINILQLLYCHLYMPTSNEDVVLI